MIHEEVSDSKSLALSEHEGHDVWIGTESGTFSAPTTILRCEDCLRELIRFEPYREY